MSIDRPPTAQLPPRSRRGCAGFLVGGLLGIVLCGALALVGEEWPLAALSDSVAVVRIEGPINESASTVKLLRQMRENSRIKAVVIRIDSPGGAVGASEEIHREVVRLREEAKKPVVVSMGNVAASGGYYIAAPADEIYANAGTLTGSIGVIAFDLNVREIMERIGVRPVVLKSGDLKDAMSPFHDMTAQERRLMQGVIYDMYRQFVRAVLKGRHRQIEEALKREPGVVDAVVVPSETRSQGLQFAAEAFTTGSLAAETGAAPETEDALRAIADGRVLTGDQARRLGLVDRMGGLQDAIDRAGELSGLGKNPPVVDRKPASAIPLLLGGKAREFWSEFTRGGTTVETRAGN